MATALAQPEAEQTLIEPMPGESQVDYIERVHRSAEGNTDEKTAIAHRGWIEAGREKELQEAAARRFPAEKFVRVPSRCVFTEHTTTRVERDPETGESREEPVVYDRDALQAICDRCNHRILDTGDFPPLTEGHTPEQEAVDKGAKQPDVLGYAGPFRLGIIGNVNPRWAIFCDEWWQKADIERLERLQRRSPEVWMEERMEDRFFDPIACLGAETPRLDMGLTRFGRFFHAAGGDGAEVARYAAPAAFPSGTNTFIPGGDDDDPPKQYAAGENEMSGSNDALIRQVVEAVMGLDVIQELSALLPFIKKLASEDSAEAGGEGGAANETADSTVAPENVEALPEGADKDEYASLPPEQNKAMWAKLDSMGERFVDTKTGESFYDDSRTDGKWPTKSKNSADESSDDGPAYDPDDEDREILSRYMSGKCDDDEMQQYMSRKRKRYMAEGSVDGEVTTPAEGEVEGNTDNYSRRARISKYARENRELRTELEKYRRRLEKIEAERRQADRYAKLQEKAAEGYVFDVAQELEETAGMSDEQFEIHLKRIERYERAPLADQVPPLVTPTDVVQRRQNEKYAREKNQWIAREATRLRDQGKDPSYDDLAAEYDKKHGAA